MNSNIQDFFNLVLSWLEDHALIIGIILLGTWILSKFANQIISQSIRRAIPHSHFSSREEEENRENTLIKISQNFFGIFIWLVAFSAILTELGVPIAPLITGAGIVGIAVGFGSQSLVRDIMTGLFIIAEDQFRIGDVICVENRCGTVEDMTLRITKIREADGTIHFIPNGEIKIASNKSKDFSKIDLRFDVRYETDIDHLEKVVNEVGEELKKDAQFGMFIIETPAFLRISDFKDHAIQVQITGKVYPKKQFLITGEMRKRLMKVFKQEGISLNSPLREWSLSQNHHE